MKDVECASFDNGLLIVNHCSKPVPLSPDGEIISQQPVTHRSLPGHSAAFIRTIHHDR